MSRHTLNALSIFLRTPLSLSTNSLLSGPWRDFHPLDIGHAGHTSFVFAAIRGGFSSLSLGTLFGRRVLRLAHQKQASCLLLVCRLRSFSPPSVAAFLRYCSALSTGCESLDSHTRSKPPACCWCAAFVRFRRHPWRLFLAIARHSLREASLRLAHQKQASCLLLVCRLRSFSPPSVAAFPRYRSALSTGGESTTRLPPPTALPKCSRSLS